jgi:hypothetical protein
MDGTGQGPGRLLRIREVDPPARTIKVEPSTPVPPVDAARPVMVLRWDQTPSATDQGLPTGSVPLALEAGLLITNPATMPQVARVTGCRFAIGHMQQGLLALGATLLRAENNILAMAGGMPERGLAARWAGLADLLVGRVSRAARRA